MMIARPFLVNACQSGGRRSDAGLGWDHTLRPLTPVGVAQGRHEVQTARSG
jgi:hypothetical protein